MAEPGGLPSMGLHGVGHNWSDLAAAGNNYKLPFPWTQNPHLSDFTGELHERFREEITAITIWHISENREGNTSWGQYYSDIKVRQKYYLKNL